MNEQNPNPGRFALGAHLRVFRAGYFHHGVYESDDRVFEFGGRILDKPNARIRIVTLAQFERDGRAVAVAHPSWTLVGPLPSAISPDEIIMRAEFLSKVTPIGRYNVVGFNCETAANWCVCGGYSESHQTRTIFLANAVLGLYGMYRNSKDGRYPRWFAVSRIAGPVVIGIYNMTIKAFWQDIGGQWETYKAERLADGTT